MDLINRYVYAVTKSLPEKQRADIEKELRTLIDDMVEQNDGQESYEKKVQKVLLELGDPEILADDYRGTKRYLIGPQFFDKYILVLKIVLISVFAGITTAVLVSSIFSGQSNIADITANYFSGVVFALLQAFAWTTVAFAIAERNSMNKIKDSTEKDEWSPSQLPAVPEKKAVIPLSEPIVSIIFNTIFLILLYNAPALFAVYISGDNGTAVIPIFNIAVLQGYKALLVGIFILNTLKEVLKLYGRRWTLKLSVMTAILGAVSTLMVLFLFTNNDIWNPNFVSEIVKNMNLTFDFANLWSRIKILFVAVIVFGSVIDIATSLYKGVRYNTGK